jgi:hypothetical protein
MVMRAAIFFGNRPTTVTCLHIKDISWDRGRLARRCPPRAIGTSLPMDSLENSLDLKATISGNRSRKGDGAGWKPAPQGIPTLWVRQFFRVWP